MMNGSLGLDDWSQGASLGKIHNFYLVKTDGFKTFNLDDYTECSSSCAYEEESLILEYSQNAILPPYLIGFISFLSVQSCRSI